MSYLNTDEQTLNDLAIFNKPGKASVYDLFNRTVTQGGAALLAQLFKQPLADENEINARAAVYRFFSEHEYSFPVDSVTIGMISFYMQNEDVRSQLQPGSRSLSQKFKNMVASDADYVFVEDGVSAVLRMFYQLGNFIDKLAPHIASTAFEERHQAIQTLLQASAFSILRPHISERHDVRINEILLSDLDKLIRFDQRELILQLLEYLFELDVFIAIGQVARKKQFHFARALPASGNTLRFKQVYHPHVEGAIANDLRLDEAHNILFLTGANMAGKSTLMKSIGIALYLGHMGFPVAAQELEFAVRGGIFSNINLSDNLNAGASHYYAEVLRVKEVARELSLGKRLFVIFDELFRGTNVKDAYDATLVLTRAFANKKASQFIISTHIMEAGEVLQQEPLSIQYQFLPTQMQGNTPVYTRVLKNGITADRQGMIIIENEGILTMLDNGLKHIKKEEVEPCHL